MECTLPSVCEELKCLKFRVGELESRVMGAKASIFIFTGNTGIPSYEDESSDGETALNDSIEYLAGSGLISSLNPNGVFLTGDMDYGIWDRLHAVPSPAVPSYATLLKARQAAKINDGFYSLMTQRKIYPVMGDLDFWPAQDRSSGDLPTRMAYTILRLFPNLPDAKRYYSIYDASSRTEFFVLSSGRYRDYADSDTGFLFSTDIQLGEEQHDWLAARTAASPAVNKVVIFHHPFVSLPDTFRGTQGVGAANVYSDFSTWDFQSMGVTLIVNGHSGNSFHLQRSSINIVNASAFARSRFGLTEVATSDEPPVMPAMYGQVGYSIEYFSHQPMGETITNAPIADGDSSNYIIPKNEFFRLTCSTDGLLGEFISYNPYAGSGEAVAASQLTEHSFFIPALY